MLSSGATAGMGGMVRPAMPIARGDRRDESKKRRAKHADAIREYNSTYTRRNPEKNRAWKLAWREKNREKIKQMARAARAANPRAYREWWLRKKYGLTHDAYDAMVEAQGWKCAICSVDFVKEAHRPASRCIDHDHDTKRVRGVLCSNCNLGLGRFADNVSSLRAAISYLERSRAP